MDSFCEELFGSLENETRRRVNNAVFISKDQGLSTDSEDDECDACSMSSTVTSGTLRGAAVLFGEGYNSDTSSSTTVAKILPKKRRDYDPEAHKNWLKVKNEAERQKREKELARKKREELKKKLEEEKRKEQSEQKWNQWLERKKQEAEAKAKQLQKTKSKQKVQQSTSKAWIPNDESISNFKVWLSRVNQQEEKTKLRSLAQQRLEGQLKTQRKDLSRTIYEEWCKSSSSKPKPVPMNRGIESLRGTVSSIFVNPQPWQGNLD
ncbi:vicilin-like seed storage protein At2g18540 isoform X1 [Culex quinquefasciatus]|uniref:vicilin-like seed storage protein At2g18540 isoform X1 n=1 Tax=Culex quinquefasciatus TaxID=7176 RepID=UPI0018E3E4A1|nr:vicilin-like seed storage protein At2g18540 isoform X1 [Culex quinquefasciatus]